MAVDFISDPDTKFLADNLLSTEDWDPDSLSADRLDDISKLLDVEANIPDDLLGLDGNFDLPMFDDPTSLDHDFTLSSQNAPEWMDLGDSGSDSGISSEGVSIKQEPLSPASSHCSENSLDSQQNQLPVGPIDLLNQYDIKLESPPPTPPQDGQGQTQNYSFVTNKNNCNNIKTLPAQGITITNGGIKQAITLTNVKDGTVKQVVSLNGIKAEKTPLSPNVINVLNSKVKIQPKSPIAGNAATAHIPAPPVIKTQPAAQNSTSGSSSTKPLVLTAEEFARLTAQGVLKFHPPGQEGVNANTALANVPQSGDAKVWKRQQRMIKNRESACLSRKRKKEYMQSLEGRLEQFNRENEKLRQENETLKRKLSYLESENHSLRTKMVKGGSGAVVLMTFMFLFAFNFGNLSNYIFEQPKVELPAIPQSLIHHGRQLMSVSDNESTPSTDYNVSFEYIQNALQEIQRSYMYHKASQASNSKELMVMQTLDTLSLCPKYFNKTESQRIANELTGWVLAHKKELKKKADSAAEKKKKPKRLRPLKKLKAAMMGGVDVAYGTDRGPNRYQVQVFNGRDRSYDDFIQTINRRNDTFYVVSFRRDHLLLPATAHNKTMRPRMSLMMPAMHWNETMQPKKGDIAMMQIDCEVMNTNLFHLNRDSVPAFMQDSINSTVMPTMADKEHSVNHIPRQNAP